MLILDLAAAIAIAIAHEDASIESGRSVMVQEEE